MEVDSLSMEGAGISFVLEGGGGISLLAEGNRLYGQQQEQRASDVAEGVDGRILECG